MTHHTFHKSERLCSRRVIEDLFAGGAKSFSVFPIRAVYKGKEAVAANAANKQAEADVQVLMSVSKRRFKHAVDRNRAKRQMREAYRLNKQIVGGRQLYIAFLWLSDQPVDSPRVARSIVTLLNRIAEDIQSGTGS